MTGAGIAESGVPALKDGDYRVGIDLGGTKIAAGLVDIRTGALTHFRRRPTPVAEGPAAIIRDVAKIAGEVIALARAEDRAPASVGIAVPELVDLEGRVCSDWNFSIEAIGAEIEGLLGIPAMADSDVRAAAHAEARFGAGRPHQSFVYVSLGTGMSYSLVINGRPWSGANGFAIHFASSALALPKEDDSGLTIANAEDFASGKGMQRTFAHRHGNTLEDGVRTLEAMRTEGDPAGTRILDEAAEVTGRLIAQMINMIDPEAVVLGGGLGCSTGRYREKLEQHMRENIWAERCRSIPLLLAALGEGAGVVGAALAKPLGNLRQAIKVGS
ncbi:ROK family protein [Pararhizobium sp. BT-229]|uniref:ROK family protein n=1 Tax=Pararhizobium sp. BT-229 TaxID=2986923 RepID=UPI0021F78F8D|nr:ROK family protein [Pararhizobium sp. BT-229]MCV9965150.1 ROK family protein [Pararhizobium sp. BT-229]